MYKVSITSILSKLYIIRHTSFESSTSQDNGSLSIVIAITFKAMRLLLLQKYCNINFLGMVH